MSTTRQIAEEVAVLMPIIARRIFMKFFHTVNISQTQILTIMALFEQSPCQLHELRERLEISAPTVTGIIDRLEKSGYVRRIPDKKDRRVINVGLTAKGKRMALKTKTTIKNNWEVLLAKLPKSDQELYVRILRKIQRNMK